MPRLVVIILVSLVTRPNAAHGAIDGQSAMDRLFNEYVVKLVDTLTGQAELFRAGIKNRAGLLNTTLGTAQTSTAKAADNFVDEMVNKVIEAALQAWPPNPTEVDHGRTAKAKLPRIGLRSKAGPLQFNDLGNTTLASPLSLAIGLGKIWEEANDFAKRFPAVAASCTAFTVNALGDITAQRTERSAAGRTEELRKKTRRGKNKNEQKGQEQKKDTSADEIDVPRVLAMSSYAACIAGGFWVPWFGFLERKFGENGMRSVLPKMAANNFFATPFLSLPIYFATTSFLRGQDKEAAMQRFRETYLDTLRGALAVYVPGDIAVFAMVPLHLRVPASYTLDYAWALAVSLASNRPVSAKEAKSAAAKIQASAKASACGVVNASVVLLLGLIAGSAAVFAMVRIWRDAAIERLPAAIG